MKSIDGGTSVRSNFLENGGSILIIGIFAGIFVLVLISASCCCSKLLYRDYRIFKLYMQTRQKIFYNSIIRYFYSSAIKL